MSVHILGIGTAVPNNRMSQEEAERMSSELICGTERQRRRLGAMIRRSKIDNRHTCIPHQSAYRWLGQSDQPGDGLGLSTQERMAIYSEHAGPLSVDAAEAALKASDAAADEITHLITVSCTGFASPGFDVQLIEQLDLPRGVQRTHVGYMGCHGAINGLRVAGAICGADANSRVLLCATELCSLHYRMRWDDERMIGNVLFADGSAAFVGCSATMSSQRSYSLQATGSYLMPESADLMSWQIGNHGFEMQLSGKVPEAIGQYARPWLETWLASQGQSIRSIGSWAVHPGGPRILTAIEDAFELPADALDVSRGILKELGNMSSPTILFILERMAVEKMPRPCVAIAFGPGLTIEAALLT